MAFSWIKQLVIWFKIVCQTLNSIVIGLLPSKEVSIIRFVTYANGINHNQAMISLNKNSKYEI